MAISQKDHTKPGELLSLAKTDQASATGKTRVVLSTSTVHDTGWIIYSGATDHMTYNKSLFQYMTPSSKEKVMIANGESTRSLEQDQLFSLLIFHYIIVYLSLHFQIIYCLLVKLQKNWIVWY